MILRQGKVPPVTLVVLATAAALGYLLVERAQVETRGRNFRDKKGAVERMMRGMEVIRSARKAAGLPINYDDDPMHTGLIGVDDQSGPLTTDKGELRAKQIATHPNLAAVLVGMLAEAGVQKGDVVAVGMTGSFPGANLAVLCALEELEARPVIVTSMGSSTYGANQAELTWLDMEKALYDSGVIRTRSAAASIGGDKDKGVGLNRSTIDRIWEAAKRTGVERLEAKTLVESINKRMEVYEKGAKGKPIKCYVNVGGGLASMGSSLVGKMLKAGLNQTYVEQNYPTQGVMVRMLKKGVPVVHLLDFRHLSEEYGLKARPKPEEIGEGPIFYSTKYNQVLVIGTLVTLLLLVFAAVRLDLKHALFRKHPPSPSQPPAPSEGPPQNPEPVL